MRPPVLLSPLTALSSYLLVPNPVAHAQCPGGSRHCWDGTTVTPDPSKGCEYQPCPPCPVDEYLCPSGVKVGRNPRNDCEYEACPENCPDDELVCGDGFTVVRRDPYNGCLFDPCPKECDDDQFMCDNGEVVYRNKLLNCEFDLCKSGTGGLESVCNGDVYECPSGLGFVFRDPTKAKCEFFACVAEAGSSREVDARRYNAIRDKILKSGVSSESIFTLKKSPQNLALSWIAFHDRANMSPEHPALLQRYALAVFFYSTHKFIDLESVDLSKEAAHDWVHHKNWMTESGICSWYGIQCVGKVVIGAEGLQEAVSQYDKDGTVIGLNLTSNMVEGVLPNELTALRGLKLLDLSNNLMAGTIPEKYGELRNLAYLHLHVNNLSGTFPPHLTQLRHLKVLNLEHNWLKGTLPDYFHGMPNALQIRLGLNTFTGALPQSIGACLDLQVLYLDANKFDGPIPASWGNLRKLMFLFLHRNKISGQIPKSIGGMEELRELTIRENQIDGTLPRALGSLRKLMNAYLELNKMTGEIPTELGNLKKLQTLRLFGNNFEGTVPKEVCALTENGKGHLGLIAADCGGENPKVECDCCHKCITSGEMS